MGMSCVGVPVIGILHIHIAIFFLDVSLCFCVANYIFLNDVPSFCFYVYHYGNLHLIWLQVLLGRSDVSGWGAFLKVFIKLTILYDYVRCGFPFS